MKKFFAVLMALVLVLSMGTVALAADETGTIRISNAIKDVDYTVYKMFNFEPVGGSTTTGRYTVADEKWTSFVNNEAKAYLAFDEGAGTIKWVGPTVEKDGATVLDDVAVSALAKAAVAYAIDNDIDPVATKKANADGEITFTVPLGYYAIDTSLGTICALTNVNEEFVAHEKNTAPTLEKEVEEDSTNEYGKTNDADIGQEVNFKATITVAKGAENYIMHDKMSAGLDFNAITSVKTAAGAEVAYTLKTTGTCGTDCDFEIVFDNAAVAALDAGTEIIVLYSATLNKNAVIAGEGNPNEAYISYGEESKLESTPSETITYTYQFQLVKTDEDKTVLPGATFKLYDAATGGNEIPVVEESAGVYRVAVEGETGVEIEAGYVTIKGLDSATYYLEEIKAPAGYNKLSARKEVTINAANNNATVSDVTYVSGGVQVINKTGSLLPETGGIGTTIFYVVGLALMLGAAILLITKKRMTAKAE